MRKFLNKNFEHTIKQVHGDKGIQWLAALPKLIEQCTTLWNLAQVKVFPNLTYNWVASAMRGKQAVVLKLGCNSCAIEKEYKALTAFKEYGAVPVLEYEKDWGALLLERVEPGTVLSSLFAQHDQKATEVAAQLLQKLHSAPYNQALELPLLQNELPTFEHDYAQLKPFKQKALELRARLLNTAQQVLLHGDFHQGNILLSRNNQWCIIDPAGLIGNPLYDVAVYIRNPLKELLAHPNCSVMIAQRIKDFAAYLHCSEQDLYDWVFLQTFTSAYWSLQDGLDAGNHCRFLQMLEHL